MGKKSEESLLPVSPVIGISCNRPSHRYHAGEKAEFQIDSNIMNLPVRIILSHDGEKIIAEKKTKLPAVMRSTLRKPGFLRCQVVYSENEEIQALSGAAFDPEQLKPAVPEPEDFDAFWQKALEDLEAVPTDFRIVKKGTGIFSLSCATVNGLRQYAFLYIPPRKKGPFPLKIMFGGGEAYTSLQQFRNIVSENKAAGLKNIAILFLHLPPYEPVRLLKQARRNHERFLHEIGDLRRYILMNLNKTPRDLYFYPSILGGLRLIRYASEYSEIDRRHIVYAGASHGGAFGIYFAALSPYITAAFCGVPNFGDVGGVSAGRHTPDVPEYRECWRKLLYYDTSYMARRVKIPVLISTGFRDICCPPSAVYCIRNALHGPVLMYDKVNFGHGDAAPDYSSVIEAWIRSRLSDEF